MPDEQGTGRYPPIGAYAVIGDCHTAALVSQDGSIDWYCPVRFDAPAVFCRILDADKGGYLRVAPAGRFAAERAYRDGTNVLETTYTEGGNRVRVTDLMPIHQRTRTHKGHDVGTARRVLRLIEGLDGGMEIELRFKPTFDFARATTQTWIRKRRGAIASGAHEYLTLACRDFPLEAAGDGTLVGRRRVGAGDRLWLALTHADDLDGAEEALTPGRLDPQLHRTLDYWRRWAAVCTYRGPYRDEVLRSALTLKLLTYEPTGALVAAPTTSLPEDIGGVRNWDYRFTWLRDSALILYALMTVGYRDEADDFFDWLDQTATDDPTPDLQIMYTIDGGRQLPEQILDHLRGYRESSPVRTGNAAAQQVQLDIYGEVLIAAHLYFCRGEEGGGPGEQPSHPGVRRPSRQTWNLLCRLVNDARDRWDKPGQGIWEMRSDPQDYLYGKLMCWAALDRGIRLAEEHQLEAPMDAWKQARDAVQAAILERGYDPNERAFTQAFGVPALDASSLMIPVIGFLPATDPRVQSTVNQIQKSLTQHGMVYRYCNEDGLPGGEGAFSLCSFWLVDALALAGRLHEAHTLFERVVGYANDVGLLSEEINPLTGELLGNFPQGFSHLSLIQAAVNLAKSAKHGPEEHPENEAQRAPRARHAAQQGYAADKHDRSH